MTFKLRLPARCEFVALPPANPANPLIESGRHERDADDGGLRTGTAGPVSRLARLAPAADHEALAERSAVISAEGAPYWEADHLAGLPEWTEAEIAMFEKRVARSNSLGYPDAKGRAERLLHRDRDADERRLCLECQHAGSGWRCAQREAFLLDQLQRCPSFKEKTL